MAKKRVAIVANTTWNIFNFRLNVIRKLLEEDFSITVIAPIDEYIRYKEQFPEVQHIPLNHLDRDSINPLRDFRFFLELLQIYRECKPDLIIHYTVKPNIYGGFASGRLGIPSIAVVTGLGYPFIHNGIIRQVTKMLYRQSNRFHNQVIFENIDDRNLFIEEDLIKSEQGISVKGCGLNIDHFQPRKSQQTNGKIIFSFIGRLLYDKGVKEFIQAASEVKKVCLDTQFWLAGDMDDENPSAVRKKDLLEWTKDPAVRYLGSVKDVRPIIAESDCIVLPSYREAIARSLTEAMAMSKPVIGTDTAGCREAIEEGSTGFLVPVKDFQALANAMIAFCKIDREKRIKMGKKGREKAVKEFDEKIIAEDIFSVITKII